MNVGIYGVGLLGASIGYVLKKKKWAKKVIGIGRNVNKLQTAQNLKAIDHFYTEINDQLKNIDLLIIAIPVQLIPEKVKELLPYLKEDVIITDVGSTKKEITQKIETLQNSKPFFFVGGHPMAGSEKTGAESLDPFLFQNAMYIITPSKLSDKKSLTIVKQMAQTLDANVLEMSIDDHDFAVAVISHVPHIVAASLVQTADHLDNDNNHIFSLAAGGFRDTTRIASGDPSMWVDICLDNKEKILQVMNQYQEHLNIFKKILKTGNASQLKNYFQQSKNKRDLLPRYRKGIISSMLEIVLFVPDKPGVIGNISNLLGQHDINIKDIEVLHVRENEQGSIRLGLEYNEKVDQALEILQNHGYECKLL
ncbi:MAG: prephenate dehydrogenase [Spirochaetes bacterium]|nr:prephenate dehydrogenase [Spirochaetota bacterium]